MLSKILRGARTAAFGWFFVLIIAATACGQAKQPAKPAAAKPASGSTQAARVTKVDDAAFRKLLVPNGKPLMINFWATWCGPCREEFPDLVKLDAEYRGKIDFITVTLDFEEELNTGVPKFLADMKAQMPTFLLVTPDETAAIAAVSKEWAGALPFTVIYDAKGAQTFFHQGIIDPAAVRTELNKLLSASAAAAPSTTSNDLYVLADFVKIKNGLRDEAIYYYENNWKLYRDEAKKKGVIDSYELVAASSEKNADFDLILITRFRGEDQFRNVEKNFEPILKQLRPNGPILKNDRKPTDFRQNVFLYQGRSLFL